LSFSIGHLHFSTTPVLFAAGVLVLVVMAAVCWLSWRRNPHPVRTGLLEALRFLCTTLVVLLLWKPEWRTILNPEAKPQVLVLCDDTGSMATVDALLAKNGSDEIVSRRDWISKTVTDEWTAGLEQDGANEVVVRRFGTPPEDAAKRAAIGTDLTAPIETALSEQSNLRAIILLSDGDWNTGAPPVTAAQKLRQRGAPLFAVPVGSKTSLPDLDLLAVTAPTYGIIGENVQIPFTIRSTLDREVRTVVRLRDSSGRERTKDVVLEPGVDNYNAILWRLEKEGTDTLELSLPVAEGERIESNNARRFTITGRQESIRALVVESRPRWEYRFLRNALSRDPGVKVDCLLFHPQLGPGDGIDYIQKFPEKLEDLAKYDVVFLGDVGIAPDQLSRKQTELLAGLVRNQASGVVFLPGPKGNEFTLLDTPLGDLIPVILDDKEKSGIHDTIPSPLSLTTEGRSSLLTMLGDTEEENPIVWRSLPGFYWYAPVIKAKGGATVLAVHANRRNRFGRLPLIVTSTAGNGKVLFMGIDSAWRWRRGVEDKYHYRFWGQVARWMSYQRNMAAGQRVRLYFTPDRPVPGDIVTLHANAFDPNGAPLQKGSVTVDLTAPEGTVTQIELKKNDSSWGAFDGRFRITEAGEWNLTARIGGDPKGAVETTLLVQGVQLEKTGQPARPEVLEEMTRIARGLVVPPDRFADLVAQIRSLPEPRPLENRLPLWSHWLTVAALVLLLAIFWTGRKLNGMF
jgi:hypothetical protein